MTKFYKLKYLFFTGVICLSFGCAKEHMASEDTDERPDDTTTFLNPLKPTGRDPYITSKDGYYYYMNTGRNFLVLTRTQELIYLPHAYSKTIYVPPSGAPFTADVSKAELHFLDDKWYIYFGGDNGSERNHRIYTLENSSADPLSGEWIIKSKMAAPGADIFADEGTVLQYNNKLYFLWTSVKNEVPLQDTIQTQIYIAPMSNPYTISGPRVKIAEPNYHPSNEADAWEQYRYTITLKNRNNQDSVAYRTEQRNQNPQVIKNAEGDVFVSFTANSCSSDNLSIGLLTLRKGGDPLVASDWTKNQGPVFAGNSNGTYGPGFNGFFTTLDGKETWMLYDANKFPGQGCGESRSPRIKKIGWKPDGTPDLGTPANLTDPITRPSR